MRGRGWLTRKRSDMNHPNMYACGLALCTFANIASEEMSRDLVNEIEKLLGSSNTYIRKKVRRCIVLLYSRCSQTTRRRCALCGSLNECQSWQTILLPNRRTSLPTATMVFFLRP